MPGQSYASYEAACELNKQLGLFSISSIRETEE
jgi:hypothetical protein